MPIPKGGKDRAALGAAPSVLAPGSALGSLADDANNPDNAPRRGLTQKGYSPPGTRRAPRRRQSPRASAVWISVVAALSSPPPPVCREPSRRMSPTGRSLAASPEGVPATAPVSASPPGF